MFSSLDMDEKESKGERCEGMSDKEYQATIDTFKKLRNACDEIITALENDDEEGFENGMGKFMVACMKMQAMK